MFRHAEKMAADPILGLTEAYKADPRPEKVNLGVGVFVDETGTTPVLRSVRKAEEALLGEEKSKTYQPIPGSAEFRRLSGELVFGAEWGRLADGCVAAMQSVGGTGALRVGAELIRRLRPDATVWLPRPTWGNHPAVMKAAGLKTAEYPWYDAARRGVDAEAVAEALGKVPAGDAVLLHVCCHNPTGADLDAAGWAAVAAAAEKAGWLPFFDFAYQGFGDGPEEDRAGLLAVMDRVEEGLVATSFSKNMGLYGERTGSLQIVAGTADAAEAALSHAKQLVRTLYSNPPKHGAALAAKILGDAALRAEWLEELRAMQRRIAGNREKLVAGLAARMPGADFGHILRQKGMFSYSGLDEGQVKWLREEKGIYMVKGGRINVAGLLDRQVDYVCDAIAQSLARGNA